jgi:hypothetical protein
MVEHFSGVDTVLPTPTAASLSRSVKPLAQLVAMWAITCADYFAAAVLYEQLSGLSDAELHKRGFSRRTLARDVCECCERTAGRCRANALSNRVMSTSPRPP